MRPLTIITIVLCFASQVFAYAIKNAQPGFVHTGGIEARNHSVSAKFRFQGGTVQRSCESESSSRAPWITSAEAQKCADLGIQILGQPGYWEGWNWPGGSSTYSLARLADCEFGIARVDGLDSQAMFGNLDVGYLLGNVSDAQNGLVTADGRVQASGSMLCLGAPMSFTIGKRLGPWPMWRVSEE